MANIAEDPRVNNEGRTKIMRTTTVVLRIKMRLRRITNILTWGKPLERIRITNPKVIPNHLHPLRSPLTVDANVIFAMILIIWQTLAHKKESISKMLKQSFTQIKAF